MSFSQHDTCESVVILIRDAFDGRKIDPRVSKDEAPAGEDEISSVDQKNHQRLFLSISCRLMLAKEFQ